jgi:hypothetical protein
MANDPKTLGKSKSTGAAQSAVGDRAQTADESSTQAVIPTDTEDNTGTKVPTVTGVTTTIVSRTGGCGKTVNILFHDSVTKAALLPPNNLSIDIATLAGELITSRPLTRIKGTNSYSISLANLPIPKPNGPEQGVEDLETLCGTPTASTTQAVVMSTQSAIPIECDSYYFPRVGVAFPTSELATEPQPTREAGAPQAANEPNQGTGAGTAAATSNPCSVDIPLTRVQETYTLRLFAYDTCFVDYLQNPEALIDNVEVIATPVSTSTSGARARSQATTSGQQSATLTGKTAGGFVELNGLVPHQPYLIEYAGPKDYLCITPPPQIFQNSSGQAVNLTALFQPCSKFPPCTIVFVQEACPSIRAAGLQVQAASQSGTTDAWGVLNLAPGTTGKIQFQSAGKVFVPPFIDVKSDSSTVFIVSVADLQVEQLVPKKRRFRFVDQQGQAFAHRQLRLVSPSGQEKAARTDHEGWFEGEEGWTAQADDDEFGFPEEFPLLTTEVR